MPDIFDEVSEDLRADQARTLLRRYGGLLIAAMLATLAGVGGYEWWQERQQADADAVATKLIAAQKASQLTTPPKDLAQRYADIAASGPEGYRVLANLQLAAVDWNAGRQDKAVAAWRGISDDANAPPLLRDLATVTRVEHQVDKGDANALKLDLLPIVQGGGPFRPLAVQIDALLDVRLGRTKEAQALMRTLVNDPSTPQNLRQISETLIAALGGNPTGAAK